MSCQVMTNHIKALHWLPKKISSSDFVFVIKSRKISFLVRRIINNSLDVFSCNTDGHFAHCLHFSSSLRDSEKYVRNSQNIHPYYTTSDQNSLLFERKGSRSPEGDKAATTPRKRIENASYRTKKRVESYQMQ